MNIKIFVDGCKKKGQNERGPGGWGAIIMYGDRIQFYGDFMDDVTNNKMELDGPRYALKQVLESDLIKHKRNLNIEIVSDAKYFVDGFNSWMHRWHKLGWERTKGEVKNLHEWQDLYDLKLRAKSVGKIEASWVKSHNGHIENEICDKIANFCCINKMQVDSNIENNGKLSIDMDIASLIAEHHYKDIYPSVDKFGFHSNAQMFCENGKIKVKHGRTLEGYLNSKFLTGKRKNKEGEEYILVPVELYNKLLIAASFRSA